MLEDKGFWAETTKIFKAADVVRVPVCDKSM